MVIGHRVLKPQGADGHTFEAISMPSSRLELRRWWVLLRHRGRWETGRVGRCAHASLLVVSTLCGKWDDRRWSFHFAGCILKWSIHFACIHRSHTAGVVILSCINQAEVSHVFINLPQHAYRLECVGRAPPFSSPAKPLADPASARLKPPQPGRVWEVLVNKTNNSPSRNPV